MSLGTHPSTEISFQPPEISQPPESWSSVMDEHLKKRPHAWVDFNSPAFGRFLIAKIPADYRPEAQGIRNIAFTGDGPVMLHSHGKYISHGHGSTWGEETNDSSLLQLMHDTIEKAKIGASLGNNSVLRDGHDELSQTWVLRILPGTLQNEIKANQVVELLDQSEAHFSKIEEANTTRPTDLELALF